MLQGCYGGIRGQQRGEQSRSLLMKTNRGKEEQSWAATGPHPGDSPPELRSNRQQRSVTLNPGHKQLKQRGMERRSKSGEKQPEETDTYPVTDASSLRFKCSDARGLIRFLSREFPCWIQVLNPDFIPGFGPGFQGLMWSIWSAVCGLPLLGSARLCLL